MPVKLDADGEVVLDWTAELPLATGNLVQGDGATFDLRFELDGRATEVEGLQVNGSDLPRTGSSIGVVLLVGASVGFVGVTFDRLARRRRWT